MRSICVIFDLDGTLVDSETLGNQAFLDLVPALASPVAVLVERYRGMKLATILKDIEERIGCPLSADFEQQYRARVAALFDSCLQPIPGVPEMLEALTAPKCIASSGPAAKIAQALRVSGLSQHFGTNIFSSYDVQSWKPDPGLFLHAAREMGFAPGDCVVVEDSPAGVQAAVAAGMTCFGFAAAESAAGLHAAGAHRTFVDMSALPELMGSVGSSG